MMRTVGRIFDFSLRYRCKDSSVILAITAVTICTTSAGISERSTTDTLPFEISLSPIYFASQSLSEIEESPPDIFRILLSERIVRMRISMVST